MSSVVWLLESAADTLGYQPGYISTYPERVKNLKETHFGISCVVLKFVEIFKKCLCDNRFFAGSFVKACCFFDVFETTETSDSEFFSKIQFFNFKEPELLVIFQNQILHNTGLQNSLQGQTNLGNPDNRVHQQFQVVTGLQCKLHHIIRHKNSIMITSNVFSFFFWGKIFTKN